MIDLSRNIETIKTDNICPLDRTDCVHNCGGWTGKTKCELDKVEIAWLRIAQCHSFEKDLF